jgi:hypothetical protein
MSFANDAESRIMAESIGAIDFLDKMTLSHELIPAILRLTSPKLNAAD